jgi:hypothetical protein
MEATIKIALVAMMACAVANAVAYFMCTDRECKEGAALTIVCNVVTVALLAWWDKV